MESIFENEYEITLERYKEFCNQLVGKSALKRNKRRQLLSIAIIILGFLTIIQSFGLDVIYITLGILSVGIGVFFLFFLPSIAQRKQYIFIMKSKNNLPWTRKTCFCEDHIIITEGFTTTTLNYVDIFKVTETETYFILWQNEDFVFRILKNGFTIGTYEEFKEFIYNKCPK